MTKKLATTFGKLTLALFLLSSVQLVAQNDKDDEDGGGGTYVITNKGDTLKGDIIDRDKKTNMRLDDQKIKFILSPTEKKTYAPGKIRGYYKDNAFFESVEFKKDEFAFMEVIEHGTLILYKLDLEREKKGEVEVYETQYYVKKAKDKSNPSVRIKENNFKKDMAKFCEGNEDIVDAINTKDYVFEDIEKLVRDFNKGTTETKTPKAPKEAKDEKGTKGKKGSKDEEEKEEEE